MGSLWSGTSRRVQNVDHFVSEKEDFFRAANHFKVFSPVVLGLGYEHHFLTSEVKFFPDSQNYKVAFIHYQQPSESDSQEKGEVQETVIKFHRVGPGEWRFLEGDERYYELLKGGEWYRVVDTGYPEDDEARDHAVLRARQRVRKGNYSLLFNNCEHFVTECLTGKGTSYQVKKAFKKGAKSMSAGSAASSAVLFK